MWSARARGAGLALAGVLVALALVLGARNPYTAAGRLPPALCRVDADCAVEEGCEQGVCARVGWVAGHLAYADPGSADAGALRLVVTAADLTGAGILPRTAPRDSEILAEAPGSDLFEIRELPRGRLALLALCQNGGRVAGMASFLIDERRGYRPGAGLARDEEIELAVDLSACRE